MGFGRVVFTLIGLVALLNHAFGQDEDCVPEFLWTIQVNANATLSWTIAPDTKCYPTHFLVDIARDGEAEFHFNVTDQILDVSFLGICERWAFTVTPYHEETKGVPRTFIENIPLPPHADLSIGYFNVTYAGGNIVVMAWDLLDHTYGDCSLYYRLTVVDEDLGTSTDQYLSGNSAFSFGRSPCVEYEMTLRAINKGHPNYEGPPFTIFFEMDPRPQVSPTLDSINIGATSFNMTWSLEGGNNRCPLRGLHLEGNHFNIMVDLMNWRHPEPVFVDLRSLQPDSMYFFKVVVENNGGMSPPVQLAIQTLELSPS